MNSDKKALLSQLVVPVIIGNSSRAHKLAFRLYMKYGVCPVLCGARRSFFDLFDPFTDYLKASDGDLLLRTLKDYSEKMNDYILILLPADKKDRQLLESRASELESFYIIASSYEDFKKLPPIRLA